jgi:hypothetical protein
MISLFDRKNTTLGLAGSSSEFQVSSSKFQVSSSKFQVVFSVPPSGIASIEFVDTVPNLKPET